MKYAYHRKSFGGIRRHLFDHLWSVPNELVYIGCYDVVREMGESDLNFTLELERHEVRRKNG